VPIDEIIDVVAVGDGLVAAAGAVLVILGMTAAVVPRRALGRVLAADPQPVLFDALGSHVVQVPVVQVINMAVVLNGSMATGGSMLMVVFSMKGSSHSETSFS
jgi:hypothetical protein